MSNKIENLLVALVLGLTPCSAFACAVPTPAPIVGAGLPVFLVAGGVYWLVRRLRKADREH